MSDLVQLRKDSYFRIGLTVVLLVVWFVGFSFAISLVSPIDSLIKSSPIKSSPELQKKISRIDAQAKISRIVSNNYKDLLDSYSEDTKKLKIKLETFKKSSTGLSDLLEYIATNESSYGVNTSLISLTTQSIIDPLDKSNYLQNKILVVLSQPEVNVESKPKGQEYPQRVDYFTIQSNEDISSKNITVNRSNYISQTVLNIANIKDLNFARTYSGSNTLDLKGILKLLQPLAKSSMLEDSSGRFSFTFDVFDQNVFSEKMDLILSRLTRNQELLNVGYEKYNSIATKLENSSSTLEARLLSSTPLFSVMAFRASVIVFVLVSIGAILVRALAAELNQSRRITYSAVSLHLLTTLSVEKSNYAAEVIHATCGDKNPLNISEPPSESPNSLIEKMRQEIEKAIKPATP
jgi:hypothetical protein